MILVEPGMVSGKKKLSSSAMLRTIKSVIRFRGKKKQWELKTTVMPSADLELVKTLA